MDRERLLRTMLAMATADGRISREELLLMADRAAAWGISTEQISLALEDAADGKLLLDLPSDPNEQRTLMREMVRIIGADGVMHPSEQALFAGLAVRMGLVAEEVDQIIDEVIRNDAS